MLWIVALALAVAAGVGIARTLNPHGSATTRMTIGAAATVIAAACFLLAGVFQVTAIARVVDTDRPGSVACGTAFGAAMDNSTTVATDAGVVPDPAADPCRHAARKRAAAVIGTEVVLVGVVITSGEWRRRRGRPQSLPTLRTV